MSCLITIDANVQHGNCPAWLTNSSFRHMQSANMEAKRRKIVNSNHFCISFFLTCHCDFIYGGKKQFRKLSKQKGEKYDLETGNIHVSLKGDLISLTLNEYIFATR